MHSEIATSLDTLQWAVDATLLLRKHRGGWGSLAAQHCNISVSIYLQEKLRYIGATLGF